MRRRLNRWSTDIKLNLLWIIWNEINEGLPARIEKLHLLIFSLDQSTGNDRHALGIAQETKAVGSGRA